MESFSGPFDVFPMQTQFRSSESVKLCVRVPLESLDNTIDLRVLHRSKMISHTTMTFEELRDRDGIVDIGTVADGGYHVLAQIVGTDARARTAFDVADHWRSAPRYSFLSDFDPRDSLEDIKEFFRKFHLNVVQFYDWMERHDKLVPTADEFVDPMGRKHVTSGILSRIHAMEDIGSASIAYAAVYASLRDYAESHPNEGLYNNEGRQLSLDEFFFLMDITGESSWREHILPEFSKVIDFGFDGLHLDQYGFPMSAVRKNGSTLWMDQAYASFIDACREELGQSVGLIFNNVSSYPVHATSDSLQDSIYVEVWPPMVRYRHLSELITQIRIRTKGRKQVILAAYLKTFRQQREANPDALARSALLVSAIIFASGGYHLVLGESSGTLTEAYYPDYVAMPKPLLQPLRAMYDVLTADGDLLAGPDNIDVTWSFVGGINQTIRIEGAPLSVEPEAGSVWVRVVLTPKGLLMHLVNLTWLTGDEWNAVHEEPFSASPSLTIRIAWNHPAREVLLQRADIGGWETTEPRWVSDGQGRDLEIAIPPIDYWSLIFVPYAPDEDHE